MVNLGVQIDLETVQMYVLPFCTVDDVKLTIKKLNNLKVSSKNAVNSLLIVLLQNNNVIQAAELCKF